MIDDFGMAGLAGVVLAMYGLIRAWRLVKRLVF